MSELEEKKSRRSRSMSSYPVSIQIKTIVNAAEKFDDKNLHKLIAELSSITERKKEKQRSEIERQIELLKEKLHTL